MPNTFSTFSKDSPIHPQVIEALKIITGREFYLAQTETKHGKLWTYRTEAKRHALAHDELMCIFEGHSLDEKISIPMSPEPSYSRAIDHARNILIKIRDQHPSII